MVNWNVSSQRHNQAKQYLAIGCLVAIAIGLISARGFGLYLTATVLGLTFMVLMLVKPVWALSLMAPVVIAIPPLLSRESVGAFNASGLLDFFLFAVNVLGILAHGRRKLRRMPWAIWALFLAILWGGLLYSNVINIGIHLATRVTGTFILAINTAVSVRTEGQRMVVTGATWVGFTISLIAGIFQEMQSRVPGFRIPSLFGQSPIFAIYLVWIILMSFVFMASKRGAIRYLSIATVVVALLLDILTFTRVSWIASAVALTTVITAYPKLIKLVFVPVAIVGFGPFLSKVVTRLSSSGQNLMLQGGSFNTGNSLGWRFHAWDILLSRLVHSRHIMYGFGTGSATAEVYNIYHEFVPPHDEYVRIIYNNGIIGIVVLLVGIIITFKWILVHAQRCWKRPEQKKWIVLGLSSMVAFLLIMITDNPLDYNYANWPFWTFVGLMLSQILSVDARVPDSPDAEK